MKTKKRKKSKIKTGCCGFRSNRSEYREHLSLVEVQHTFYQPPQISTLKRWRAEMPEDFEFTVKAWQLITHTSRSPTYRRLKRALSNQESLDAGAFRPTKIVEEAWMRTLESAEALLAKVILFQSPASFTPTEENIENLTAFFSSITDRGDKKFVWEPRGRWPRELVEAICKRLKLAHVVDPFIERTVTPQFCYYRLHGRTGFRYRYEQSELEDLFEMLPKNRDSYILFNNIYMIDDAIRFQELISDYSL